MRPSRILFNEFTGLQEFPLSKKIMSFAALTFVCLERTADYFLNENSNDFGVFFWKRVIFITYMKPEELLENRFNLPRGTLWKSRKRGFPGGSVFKY